MAYKCPFFSKNKCLVILASLDAMFVFHLVRKSPVLRSQSHSLIDHGSLFDEEDGHFCVSILIIIKYLSNQQLTAKIETL